MGVTSILEEKITSLYAKYSHVDDSDDSWGWLDSLNPSQAFVVCIGAGPWKENRRFMVQSQALRGLGFCDLSQCDFRDLKLPLKWQQEKIRAIQDYLISCHGTEDHPMDAFVSLCLSNPFTATDRIHEATSTNKRSKVLSLYIRDYLKLPSFPIDRHVRRILNEEKLPLNEATLVMLCGRVGIDSRKLARRLVGGTVSNPDVSIILKEL